MPTYSLRVDSATDALVAPMVSKVQAAYDAIPGYPPLTVTTAYVLTHAVTVGLSFWIPIQYWGTYPLGGPPNVPTLALVTPTLPGSTTLSVNVLSADETYASEIVVAIGGGGGDVANVLDAALCTGLAMLNGVLAQVGPFT